MNGIQAHAKEGDDYSYVFNGIALDDFYARYESHGKGTFNINPLSGLSGLYIGDTTAA